MINKKNIILLLLTINFSCNMSQKSDNSTINALIETNKGEIITELFFKQTPVTVANFISLLRVIISKLVNNIKEKIIITD